MFKIFPVTITPDGRKVPLIQGWKEKAVFTSDTETIRLWQELYRDRLHFFGVPTGEASDLLVLDVDVKHNGFENLHKLGLVVPETCWQRTRSGGAHYLFKYPKNGRTYGNKQNLFGSKDSPSGVDCRGEGGYIVYYGEQFGCDFTKPFAEAPDWLLSHALRTEVDHQGSTLQVSPAIAQGIIQTSLDAIRDAPTGESNDTLNKEGFKIGQLVASGSVSREYAEQALLDAALARGKPVYEAKATIKSALDGGLAKPLTHAFGAAEPLVLIDMVPPPPENANWTPAPMTIHDLMNTSKLRKPQLFDGWSTEDISITTADGGTGKTTLKLYEAVCLALGERFLGFDCKQSGKTLFITGEDTDKKLAAMLGAVVRDMGLFEKRIGNDERVQKVLQSIYIKKDSDLCLITKDKQGFLHLNRDAMNKVMQAVDEIKPKLIVFDPISSFWGSEAALNDMAKAVAKFMQELAERSGACVEIVNHMGKQSSNNKDMSQFAGRGGTGLPSHARVSRVLRPVFEDEYTDLTGETLKEDQSAMMCNVNKFSDGSPLYNKPFLIVRDGYLFNRKVLSPQKAKEAEKNFSDVERVFGFIQEARRSDKYPTREIAVAHFMSNGDPISGERVKRALNLLQFNGHMGQKIRMTEHPDATIREKAYVITDMEGKES
jgi:RecA-family ATPase